MFELEVNHDRATSKCIPDEIKQHFQNVDKNILGIAVLPWEEHCTECAMPACYETCDLYEPRKDGKCRRFIGGVVPVNEVSNIQNYVVRVAFKRWGQLMAYSNIRMIPLNKAKRIERTIHALDELISKIPDYRLSIRGRRGLSSRLTRKIKQSIASKGWFENKIAGKPNYFVAEIYNPNSYTVDLSLSINNSDPDTYNMGFQKLLEVKSGYCKYQITFDEIEQRVDFSSKFNISFNPNVLSEEDEGLTLYFGLMTFVWESHHLTNEIATKPLEKEKHAPYVKVIAWDLDNTVWDGTLLEDGAENLTLKPGVVEIIKQLDNRGILNTVVSKNNADDALKQLDRIGLSEYILHPKIGWGQKGLYLKELVKQFNVAENTFAFIDDSPFERDEVASLNPRMRVYDADLYDTLLEREEFSPPVTTDSHQRRDFYRLEEKRGVALSTFDGEYLTFLKECNITLRIYKPKKDNLDRIHELVQRTNQLNFSGNRYKKEEIENLLTNPEFDCYCLDCDDKYGKYGTVGFAVVKNKEALLIDLMLSCRVQSKRVEHAFMGFLLSHYKKQSYEVFSALYLQTERNTKVGAVFGDMKFTEIEGSNQARKFVYSLNDAIHFDGVIRIYWNDKEWSI